MSFIHVIFGLLLLVFLFIIYLSFNHNLDETKWEAIKKIPPYSRYSILGRSGFILLMRVISVLATVVLIIVYIGLIT